MTSPLLVAAKVLRRALRELSFGPPITHVYNPLEYAWGTHTQYLEMFGRGPKEVVLVGMNPGPYGMAQTGIPFGEVEHVRGWMGIDGEVGRPSLEHPKRPIEGFACPRSEVSGRRLWGFARARFGNPEAFFRRFFVLNYCPLVFMEESGKNRTPDKLPVSERIPLFSLCDAALATSVQALSPSYVIGVGVFAEQRAREVFADTAVRVGRLLHPSPASPAANRGWSQAAAREFEALGIRLPPTRETSSG